MPFELKGRVAGLAACGRRFLLHRQASPLRASYVLGPGRGLEPLKRRISLLATSGLGIFPGYYRRPGGGFERREK